MHDFDHEVASYSLEMPIWTWDLLSNNKVANMTLGKGSVLEDHLEAMKEMEKSLAEFRVNFNELEEINHEMQEAMVFENQHTSYSMEVSRCDVFFSWDISFRIIIFCFKLIYFIKIVIFY